MQKDKYKDLREWAEEGIARQERAQGRRSILAPDFLAAPLISCVLDNDFEVAGIIFRKLSESPHPDECMRAHPNPIIFSALSHWCKFSNCELILPSLDSASAIPKIITIATLLSICTDIPVTIPFVIDESLDTIARLQEPTLNATLLDSARINVKEMYALKEERARAALSLLPHFERLQQLSQFRLACDLFFKSHLSRNSELAVVENWMAIESLFPFDQEIRFRLSLSVAFIIGDSLEEREKIYKDLLVSYNARSKIAHGKKVTKIDMENTLRSIRRYSRLLLLETIIHGDMFSPTQIENLIFGRAPAARSLNERSMLTSTPPSP